MTHQIRQATSWRIATRTTALARIRAAQKYLRDELSGHSWQYAAGAPIGLCACRWEREYGFLDTLQRKFRLSDKARQTVARYALRYITKFISDGKAADEKRRRQKQGVQGLLPGIAS